MSDKFTKNITFAETKTILKIDSDYNCNKCLKDFT